jgi:DNA phosphorothioation-associated putative methyltransferase
MVPILNTSNDWASTAGWDPYFQPDVPQTPADVVNLGYVINVIEDTAERREALINAWKLAQKVLIVAAQVLIDDRTRGVIAYGDGIITSRNTFQKYYEQEELKAYIDQVLGVDAIPVALGIYFVFRDEAQAEGLSGLPLPFPRHRPPHSPQGQQVRGIPRTATAPDGFLHRSRSPPHGRRT